MASTKRRKIIADPNRPNQRFDELPESMKRNDVTHFEDLSNEVIYEIFHCLDSCQIYDAFFNLNSRFRDLVFHSNFPIQIHFLRTLSRNDFHRYYNQILLPNQHRVQLLDVLNSFIIERLFSSTYIFLQLNQLETLILNPIESKHPEILLDYLLTLPALSTLVLIYESSRLQRDEIYHRVFRFPALTYCKLSFKRSSRYQSLPIQTNSFSPIEHFITTNVNNISELPIILSYLPRLKRLSIHSPNYSHLKDIEQTLLPPSIYLTHVTLNIPHITFDDFQSLARCCFHQIQVLHMSILMRTMSLFLDADQWRSLIVSSMTLLRIFDIFIRALLWNNTHATDYLQVVKRFQGPFWLEQGWKFSYFSFGNWDNVFFRFFSINPYRRKKFILDERQDFINNLHRQKISIKSVEQLKICNLKSIDNYPMNFPHVTHLTIIDKDLSEFPSILSNNLNKILPLHQLTQFNYETFNWHFIEIIQFFQHMPNLEIFHIHFRAFIDWNFTSIEENDTFQFVSKNNRITKLVITTQCTLNDIDILIALCPRVKQLVIDKAGEYSDDFFANIQNKLQDLVFLSVNCGCSDELERLQTLIESERLLSKCSIQSNISTNILSFWF